MVECSTHMFMHESIFHFNSAADKEGVIALIVSSMYVEINRTNILNNTAQFGSVISACISQITFLEALLIITTTLLKIGYCNSTFRGTQTYV